MSQVSVLMPIYNTKEEYLREAIDSILSQTFSDFEFLILNDSPDNKKLDVIVTSYKDDRIKYIKNEKNIGITASRNRLIDLAKGEFLVVMDHDDVSLPKRVEKEINLLKDNPDIGVVGTAAERFPNKKLLQYPTEDEDIRIALIGSSIMIHPACMIRKSVLVNYAVRYEGQFSPCEDYALWRRLLPVTKFHNIPEVLFHYREHNSNTSKVQNKKMADNSLKLQAMMKTENPDLYKKWLLGSVQTIRMRLLGCIPILKIIKNGSQKTIYLFDKIPLLTIKNKMVYPL